VLDIRASDYVSPVSEVPFESIPLTVHILNVADETGLVTGKFRVYNDTTGLLIHTSDIAPFSLTAGAVLNASALTDFDPPAPADDTYFVIFDGNASNALVPDGINFTLGAFYFDVKPAGLGPAPQTHAPTHVEGGGDMIEVADMGTAELDDTLVLQPDGAGGVSWQAIPTAKGAFAEATDATPTPDADLYVQYALTALDTDADFQVPAGTPVDGQVLRIRILDDSTPRNLTWDAIYASRGATLPVITVAGKLMMVGLIYNNDLGTWDCVAVTTEA
jgi:hypothetical protein